MRELHDMKARVSQRPYLFEQVKQVGTKKLQHHLTIYTMRNSTSVNFDLLFFNGREMQRPMQSRTTGVNSKTLG